MNYIDKRTLDCAKYLINYNSTIRKTAQNFNLSKSTLHSDFHKRLPKIDKKLYCCVMDILDKNYQEKHIRGGQSTKNKFKKQTKKEHL